MMILHLLFQFFIEPLVLLLEVLFRLSLQLSGDNVALAIVPLSIAVNLLCLPLYLRADAIQHQNRLLEQQMRPMLNHIRQAFHGDERFMMTQAYYRTCGYSPWFALRNSYSLLLQIPFFIAAYYMLSHTPYLDGVSLGPIADLGSPDGLLTIGGLTVNVLPILMTAINIASGWVYMKGSVSWSDRLQFYGLALVFLVLLYNSPAGLVFYWILNQLFSFAKNVIMARREKKENYRRQSWLADVRNYLTEQLLGKANTASDWRVFLLACLTAAVLTGLLIPSAVVDDSTVSFFTDGSYLSPFSHLLSATMLALGTFVAWPSVFYSLAGPKSRKLFEVLAWSLSIILIANYMFFGRHLGNISPFLVLEDNPVILKASVTRNLVVGFGLTFCLFLLWQEYRNKVRAFQTIVLLVLTGMLAINVWNISGHIAQAKKAHTLEANERPDFHFSRNGKNVIVLMIDRAISGYIPYIINEKPELKQQFSGFTYYPNTMSFGAQTNSGGPALYGGYEYMPEILNQRDSVLLKDKHDEALKLMPVLFSQAGYDVTVTDPPYAGYSESPDLSIYDGYPGIKAYKDLFPLVGDDEKAAIWQRNFMRFSLMRTLPLFMQPWFYDRGFYQGTNPDRALNTVQVSKSRSVAQGTDAYFMREEKAMSSLPEMSKVDDAGQNHFLMYYSLMAHSPALLSEPDYTPSKLVDNTAYDQAHEDRFTLNGRRVKMESAKQMSHYHVNMATMLHLGKWFDYLREQGVYDNTRIIVVSDHGSRLESFDDLIKPVEDNDFIDLTSFSALLLVKDFNAQGELRTDNTFMTNAETPTLALKELIENPLNPFTGNAVTDEARHDKQHKALATNWRVWQNNGYKYLDGKWAILDGDNFFDRSKWHYIDLNRN